MASIIDDEGEKGLPEYVLPSDVFSYIQKGGIWLSSKGQEKSETT